MNKIKVLSKSTIGFVLVIFGLMFMMRCLNLGSTFSNTATAAEQEPVKTTAAVAGSEGWILQFSDNFDRVELGADWAITKGWWYIENGMLVGGIDKITVNETICTKEFSGSQRLEFDAVSDNPGDLTGLLCINEMGYVSGYFFGFGSDENAHSKLLIEGREWKRYDKVITPGKLHHVVCQREGNKITHIVDGEVVMTFIHDTPVKGPGHEMVGFCIWSIGKIDNVKVYTKAEE